MNVVDSSVWIAYFRDEKHAEDFAEPIEDRRRLLGPSSTLHEVFRFMYRNLDEAAALKAVAHMNQGSVVPLDSALAIDAAGYAVQLKLPLADSIIYATAKQHNAKIWTRDADFEGLPGVKLYP